MDWRDVPSLAALRAFEAAARTGSLSAAARELNVTHAAVAQHLRTLTDHFGEVLLERDGRGMSLTPTGRNLSEAVTEGFSRISGAVAEIRSSNEVRPLALTTTPNFAENWLMPRLSRFWRSHPEVALSIQPSPDLTDLRRDGFDIAIRYGRAGWQGVDCEFLASASFVIVAAPGLLRGDTIKPSDLSSETWLVEADHTEPIHWARTSGMLPPNARIEPLATMGMVLSGVRAGVGLAVISKALVEGDVRRGNLIVLHEAPQEKLGYYILTRPGLVSSRVRTFIKWLRAEAQDGAGDAKIHAHGLRMDPA